MTLTLVGRLSFLNGRDEEEHFSSNDLAIWSPTMEELPVQEVRIITLPIPLLLTVGAKNETIPSANAKPATAAGLDVLSWSLEHSGFFHEGWEFYYKIIHSAINNDGNMLNVVDVLARKVGVRGIFSDWAGTGTCYANCTGR